MKTSKIIIGLLVLLIITQSYFINKVNDSLELTYLSENRYSINKVNNDIFLLDKNTGRTWILLTSEEKGVTWDPLAYSIYVRNDDEISNLLKTDNPNYNYTFFASTIEAYPKNSNYFEGQATEFVDSIIRKSENSGIVDPKYKGVRMTRESAIHTLKDIDNKDYFFDQFSSVRKKELAPVIEQLKKEYESK